MNADQVETTLRIIKGAWPAPGLEQEEAMVLGSILADYEMDEAEDAIKQLGAREFRPNPTILKAMLGSVRQHNADKASLGRELGTTSLDRESRLLDESNLLAKAYYGKRQCSYVEKVLRERAALKHWDNETLAKELAHAIPAGGDVDRWLERIRADT